MHIFVLSRQLETDQLLIFTVKVINQACLPSQQTQIFYLDLSEVKKPPSPAHSQRMLPTKTFKLNKQQFLNEEVLKP